jgi:hypothetical protein
MASATSGRAMDEYRAAFSIASDLVLRRADRASLIIFVGWDPKFDFFASLIGMLPFRGVTTALITQRTSHGDLLSCRSPSGVFELQSRNSARLGLIPVKAVFGPLEDLEINTTVEAWHPVDISPVAKLDKVTTHNFKIAGLPIPMLTDHSPYKESVERLGKLLKAQYQTFFPVVSCGEQCDALGYGQDVLDACGQEYGYYFTHRSGETYKSWETYGTEELFKQIEWAKQRQLPVVIIAVGGGVNGNCIGMIAATTESLFVEFPTTPMHYNDATTSAKKAFY